MTVDIVINSCKRDLHWLSYCLQFLEKNWREPGSKIIVKIEEDCREIVGTWGVKVEYRYVKPWRDTYMFQCYQKVISDDYSDADLLMLVDSDCMLLRPAQLSDLMQDGKPVIEYVEWGDDSVKVSEKVWRAPTSRVMGMDLYADLMIRMPALYWRDTFSKTRQRIVNVTGKGFFDAVYSDVPFTAAGFMTHPITFADFECLNLYAAKFQSDRYVLMPREQRKGEWPFHLYWSHGDWSPKIQGFLDSQLKRIWPFAEDSATADPYVQRANS